MGPHISLAREGVRLSQYRYRAVIETAPNRKLFNIHEPQPS